MTAGTMTTEELSEDLNVPAATVVAWRYKGSGPPYIKVGKYVRYPREEYVTWHAAKLRGFAPDDADS